MKKSFKDISRALLFIWESSKQWTIAHLFLLVLQAILPLATLYLMKLIIDSITIRSGAIQEVDFQQILYYIVLFGIVTLSVSIVDILSNLVKETQQQLVTDYMSTLIQQKSIELDLAYYEMPDHRDTFHRAQHEAIYRPIFVFESVTDIFKNGLSLLAISGLLIYLHWGIALVLILTSIPSFLVKIKYAKVIYEWDRNQTQLNRKGNYYNSLLTHSYSAKEVRIFNLATIFKNKFQEIREQLFAEKFRILKHRSAFALLARLGEVIAVILTYAFITYRTVQGNITVGGLVMYFQAFQKGQTYLLQSMQGFAKLYQNRLFLSYIFEFFQLNSTVEEVEKPIALNERMQKGIHFDGVSFRYHIDRKPALENISLNLEKGKVIALVGENGSGKTTFVKLLCRLYDPSSGTIRYDGVDMKQAPLKQLRSKFSVIFQHFVNYSFTVFENIRVSEMEKPLDTARAYDAAERSDAASFIKDLPKQYENMLGTNFEKGAELSGGQWQKIALSRAFYKDAEVIVLDEPTGAIDPLAEHHIFSQLKTLAKDRIIILITHRIYNLKLADQICVFEKGSIVEKGQHDDLIALDGLYKKMFDKQQ